MELMVQEDNFLIKTLNAHEEMEQGYRLRHEVFSEELRWVPVSEDGKEVDDYDGFASCLGVFDEGQNLVGHARLITSPNPFMIDREFACLITEGQKIEKSRDMAEITRLCVKRDGRKGDYLLRVSNLLYRGIYHWSAMRGIRHLIMVVDWRYFRLLRFTGIPVRAMGSFKVMPDKVHAGVISLDLDEFRKVARVKSPEFYYWVTKAPAPVPSPGLLHGLC